MERADLQRELLYAIVEGNKDDVVAALAQIPNALENRVGFLRVPLVNAVAYSRFDIAELLLAAGADLNYNSALHCRTLFSGDPGRAPVVLFLLRNGRHIPRNLSPSVQAVVDAYVFRDWTPENHFDWPVLVQKQIVAILGSFLSKRGSRGLPFLTLRLLFRLFSFVATAHFVWQ